MGKLFKSIKTEEKCGLNTKGNNVFVWDMSESADIQVFTRIMVGCNVNLCS